MKADNKEAMKLALEALEAMQSYAAAERKGLRICDEAITALREVLAKPDFWEGYVPESDKRQQALDKKAENARELGLDYEPAQPRAWFTIDELNAWADKKLKENPQWAEQPAQQEPVAWICEGPSSDEKHAIDYWPEDVDDLPIGTQLYTSPPAQRPHECSRSHPHENMDAMCELRTEIARLTNENARLKAQLQQEPFGYLYEGTAEHTRHKTVFEKTRAERFETRWWREIGPCYTSPPAQRTWVGLTDEEIEQSCVPLGAAMLSFTEVARAIEAKLKEKNT